MEVLLLAVALIAVAALWRAAPAARAGNVPPASDACRPDDDVALPVAADVADDDWGNPGLGGDAGAAWTPAGGDLFGDDMPGTVSGSLWDDDPIRGLWDATSIYYPMMHPDDGATALFHHDDGAGLSSSHWDDSWSDTTTWPSGVAPFDDD